MNRKILLSLFPGIIFGMFIQHRLEAGEKEIPSTEKFMASIVSSADVSESTARYKNDATITSQQKVYGASFERDAVQSILNSANANVYVRIGLVNSHMTLYIGNDNNDYINPAADGYCPSNCPFN